MTRFHVINLGCKVNKVESDSYAAQCLSAGLHRGSLEEADLVVVNTCAVTGEAEKKTRKTVHRVCAVNSDARILVTGCSAALHASVYEEMSSRIVVLSKAFTPEYLKGLLRDTYNAHEASEKTIIPVGEGFRSRVGIKVQDGCDNDCSYCIVHVARGKATSRDAHQVLEEVKALDASGVKEVVLSGINLGSYRGFFEGASLDLAALLLLLLEATDHHESSEPLMRFRVGSIEPLDVSEDVINLLASSGGRVCRHLHLPLQSGSNKVLSDMNRPYSADTFCSLVKRIRRKVPSLSLSTDIIVGFPGETEHEFEESCSVAQECSFSKIHVFPYSRREGTPAAQRSDQIDASVKSARASKLRELSAQLAVSDQESRRGSTELALVESDGTMMTESYHLVEAVGDCKKGSLVPYLFA